MGKKKDERQHARRIKRIDEAAEALAANFRRYGRDAPAFLVAIMAVAMYQAQRRDARAAVGKGDLPKEGESCILVYNVQKETGALLNANPELAMYADYLAYLHQARPAWLDGRSEGGDPQEEPSSECFFL